MDDAPPSEDRSQLGPWLSRRLGDRWTVSFGRSRTAPVQARHTSEGWELRLHRMFASAPNEVLDALARWLAVGRRARRASRLLDEWIHTELESSDPPRRPTRLEPVGRTHDLAAMAESALALDFAGEFGAEHPAPVVTWGRRARSRSRRSLRLGSFDPETHLVRIHPVLDQAAVPTWFVRFVLKHEILHAVLPPYRGPDGRWIHHGPDFRRRERAWPEYSAAVSWEERNLPRLIRSAREGTALRVRAQDLELPLGSGGRHLGRIEIAGAAPVAARRSATAPRAVQLDLFS